MRSPNLLSRAKVAATTLIAAAALNASAQQLPLPSPSAIAKESAKQAPKSAAAISRADRQSQLLRQPVPDVASSAPLATPDPAQIARRFEPVPRTEGFFVLISLSMPAETVERLADQARKAGAPMVLRGVTDGSLKLTMEKTADIVRKHPGAEIQIDPTLFRRFSVNQVPAFVLSVRPSDNQTCGKDCDARNTFVMVAGDVSVDYALEHIAKQPDARFAKLARARLQRYKDSP